MTPSEACVSNCTWWMWMFDLREVVRGVGVAELAGQRHGIALADVGAQRQRLERLRAVEHCRPCRGPGRRPCRSGRCRLRRDLHRVLDRHDVEAARHGRGAVGLLGRADPVGAPGERIECVAVIGAVGAALPDLAEVRRTGVPVRRERWSDPDVWSQHRERRSAVERVEHQHRPVADERVVGQRRRVAGLRRVVVVVRVGRGVLGLAQVLGRSSPGWCVQFHTAASLEFLRTPFGGSCGRIQPSRFAAVIFWPLIVRPISPAESTGVGGTRPMARGRPAARSRAGGCRTRARSPTCRPRSARRCGSGTGSRPRPAARRRRRPRSRGCTTPPGPNACESRRSESDSSIGCLFSPVSA